MNKWEGFLERLALDQAKVNFAGLTAERYAKDNLIVLRAKLLPLLEAGDAMACDGSAAYIKRTRKEWVAAQSCGGEVNAHDPRI